MAIAHEASVSTHSTAGVASLSVSVTPSGVDRLLVATAAKAHYSASGNPGTPTWNSETLTHIVSGAHDWHGIHAYQLVAPALTTANLTCSFPPNIFAALAGTVYSGVDQSAPIGATGSAAHYWSENSSAPLPVSASSAADALVHGAISIQGASPITVTGAGGTQVERVTVSTTSPNFGFRVATKPGEATTTLSWTENVTEVEGAGLLAFSINPASGEPEPDPIDGVIATGAPAQSSAVLAALGLAAALAVGAPAQSSAVTASAHVRATAATAAPAQSSAANAQLGYAGAAQTAAPAQTSALAARLALAASAQTGAPAQAAAALAALGVGAALQTGAPSQAASALAALGLDGLVQTGAPPQASATAARLTIAATATSAAARQTTALTGIVETEGVSGSVASRAPAQSANAAARLALAAQLATAAPAQTAGLSVAARILAAAANAAPAQAAAIAGAVETDDDSVICALLTSAPAQSAGAVARARVRAVLIGVAPPQSASMAAAAPAHGAIASAAPAQASALVLDVAGDERITTQALDRAAARIAAAILTRVEREPIGALDADADSDGVTLIAALSEGGATELGYILGGGPRAYEFEQRAAFELIAIGGDDNQRKLRVARALAVAYRVIEADPTLGGLVDYAVLEQPDPSDEIRYAALAAVLVLTFTAPTALG